MIFIYLLVLALSFYFLAVIVDEFFVESLDVISEKLKLSSDVAGATFMAVGSSAPELFVSLIAVLRPGDHANIGVATIVGSAIFNILVIIGVSAMYRKAKLNWQPVVRDTLFYCLAIVVLLITFWDGQITLLDALLFVSIYVIYLIAVVNWKKWFPYEDGRGRARDPFKEDDPLELLDQETKKNKLAVASKKFLSAIIPDSSKDPRKYLVTFFVCIGLIGFLSLVLVESAVGIGEILRISPAIIALTVLAAGTSIPDLLSSIAVAKQGRGDMAVSNAIGSNTFDILIGLGVPWLIVILASGSIVTVSNENLISSVFLLFATVVAVFFLLVMQKWTIGRRAGLILVLLYLAYLGWNIWQVLW